MKIILATLMGLVAFSGFAGVVVYKNSFTYTTTGGGSVSSFVATGWTVMDTATGSTIELGLNKSKKYFQVITNAGTEINYVTGASGRQYMVLYAQPLSGSGLGTATGVATSLNIGTFPISTFTAAKTLTVSSSYVFEVNLTTYWQAAKGSATFDSRTTLTQNGIDGNFNNTVQRLADLLLSEGYTKAD